jgi:hypothetical protein
MLFVPNQPVDELQAEELLPPGAHFLREPPGAEDLIGKLQQHLAKHAAPH